MAYTPHTWQTSEPITQEKMNNIEEGIQERALTSTLNSNVQSLQGSISDVQTIAQSAKNTAENAQRDVAAAQQGSVQGQIAWSQVAPLTSYYTDANGNIAFNTNLKTRIENHEQATDTAINNINEKIGGSYTSSNTVYADINGVRSNLTIVQGIVNRAKGTYSDIQARLDANDATVETHAQAIEGINDKYTNAKGTYATIEARFKATEDEVKDARGTYADIDARLDADETDIGTNRSNIVTLNDTVVFKSNVIDDFTHTDTQKPLSANKGKELKETIGGTYNTTNTVAAGIISAANTAENNAKAYADTNKVAKSNIYNDIDYMPAQGATDDKVLDARQGKVLSDLISNMGTAYQAADSALDSRLDAIEGELDDACINSGTLDDRFDAVELRATTLETQVTNIANELNMTNIAGQIQDTTSRIDTLESNVVAMANEIGMLQNGAAVQDMASAIAGDSTRIDTIEADLNTASTGIKARMSAAEAAISHAAEGNDPGGLSERMTAAESAISTKANASDVTSALSNKADTSYVDTQLAGKANVNDVSLTIVKAKNEVTYVDTENGKVPSGTQNWTIIDKNDYLLQNPTDDKYYYWKHINNTWHLMGGAGGGSGNTSGYDLTQVAYEAIGSTTAGYQANTDYYVTKTDGVHHYRYTLVNDVLTEIEIGQLLDSNQIKRYNMTTSVTGEGAEQVTYLDLYEFNYGIDNTVMDESAATLRAHVPLPQGGGSGPINNITARLVRIGDETIQTIINSSKHIYVFYSAWDSDQSYSGNYTLKYNGTVIDTGVFASGPINATPINWIVVEEPQFENDEPVISSPDSTKLYIVKTGNTYTQWTYDSNTWTSVAGAPNGFYALDISEQCKRANINNTISLAVAYGENTTPVGKSWKLNIYDLAIESNAPDTLLISNESSYSFQYIPFGALTKTLHVLVDNVEIGTQTLISATSGRVNSYSIPAQAHGAHTIKMYLTANIGGSIQTTEPVIREYIWYDIEDTETPVILASKYNNQTITAQQYSTIEIPYQVYKKDAETIDVYYYLDNAENPFDHVVLEGVNDGKLSYLASSSGSHTLTIKVDNVTISTSLSITELDINVAPVNGAVIDFDPTSLTNSSANRLPTWTDGNETYHLTTSDNFNWSDDISGGGYKEDKDGRCFIIKAGSYIDLDYPMFKRTNGQTVLDRGAEMKIIFKVAAVRDIDAVWFNNTGTLTNKTVGIQLNAHNGWLKTDQATDRDVKDTVEEYPAWESNHVYAVDDVVVAKNVIYKCIAVNTNFTLVVPIDSSMTKYWAGVGINTWTSGTEYVVNNGVSYDGKKYICIKDIPVEDTTITPDTEDNEYWKEFTDVTWTSGTEYLTGSVVLYNNNYYIATKDVINELAVNPKDSGNWLKMGATESEILATNSYLYFPYSEEDKIELDININAHEANTDNNFIMSYEDGVPSKAYAYTYGLSGDSIYHDNTIRIGSPDCDVYIYRLRIYKNALETADILQNFIADGRNIDEKVSRYNRNCIYWDDQQEQYFTSPSGTAILDPIKLAERIPDVKILMLDTPVFTVGKKNFVQGSTLRCIHAEGGKVYESRGDADNWFFQDGFHAGQGTTSDNYGQSARNVDFLFIADQNQHYPTKAKNMKGYDPKTANYVSSVLVGKEASKWVEDPNSPGDYHWEAAEGVTPDECVDWKGDTCKVSLTSSSVPNNYFNLKVNVASSENVNNALFQKRYNDFLEYTSPAHTNQMAVHGAAYRAMGLNPDNIKVKNGMEFVPAILFIRENDPDLTKHTEFNDTKWHFYALGNIGDSKKTDYTRAYDPNDMNEFTCENSDNNTNNGQFQSGVFMYNGIKAVETDYNEWANDTAYNQNDIIVKEGRMYQRYGANMAPIPEGTTAAWIAADWTDITPTTTKTIYYAPRTNPNPMDYIYGIDPEEWNTKMTVPDAEGTYHYINRKHDTLVTEEFDGDHSFEFRYACCGDYRDGDLINDTTGQAKQQFNINHDVLLAFYEWLVTSTDEQYEAEATQWIIKPAMEFFYAFTHYYTMMDNRAKNTFWHFAKTGQYHKVSRPNAALFHTYEVSSNATRDTSDPSDTNLWIGTFTPATGEFDPNGNYYTQYAFDLWVYDTDTAAGIDNNGALVFPYGKEDEDYRVDGEPSSGYAFNGAGSIFWRRLKNTFSDEIAEVMNNADAACFNSEDLINQFDSFQNCFPEEIWRLDIERKYIRTFTGIDQLHPYDNAVSVGKQNPRFLTSMMQGRKKYQRRQWIRDQGVYFNSKYRLTDIIKNDNTIEFNVITPTNSESLAVTPSYMLELTPYQDMYLNVQVGNGNYQEQKRAKAGQKYVYNLAKNTSGTFQETRIYINGANHLSKIGNLAPMYIYGTDFRALAHLKELDIGTEEVGFTNANLTELNFSSNVPLLETLNIKNCHSLAKPINLRTANNIRTVEAEGTAITGITLPDYTNIETLHLPSTVIAVHLYAARFLKDFKIYNNAGNEDYSNLYTLSVYDSDYSADFKEDPSDPLPIDWISIALEMLEKQSPQTVLSLTGLYSATIGNINTLSTFSEAKEDLEPLGATINLSGIINVTGTWSEVEKNTYKTIWPQLTLNTNENNKQFRAKIMYKTRAYQSDSGWVPEQDIGAPVYIAADQPIPDPYAGLTNSELPTRNATIATVYQFGTVSQNNYVTYSGWTLDQSGLNPVSLYAQGYTNNNPYRAVANVPEVTLYTFFNEAPHTYTVNWYLRPDQLIKSVANQEYGGGYGLEAPTVKEIRALYNDLTTVTFNSDDTVTYTIFDGWEKLPTNISPTLADAQTSTYNINAKWYTNTVSIDDTNSAGLFNDTSEPTLEQLLVLSRMSSTNRNYHMNSNNIVTKKRFNYQMGFNGTIEGTTIVDTSNVVRYTSENSGTARAFNTIKPFATNNGFTLAIDYQFDSTQEIPNDAAVLLGCYDKVNGSVVGFALFNNQNSNYGPTGAVVGYGNMFSNDGHITSVGNVSQRNIIVIRHPANTSEIWVYTSKGSANSTLETSITSKRILLDTQVLSENAVLCLGHLRTDINNNTDFSTVEGLNTIGAEGTIYWAKYWNEDLGAGECKQLASWPHENMTAIITSIDENNTQIINNILRPAIYLTGLTNSSHVKISSPKFNTSDGTISGWNTTTAKTICANRVFNGLPIRLQSILGNTTIGYFNYQAQDLGIQGVVNSLTNLQSSQEYIYIPSVSSLGVSHTTYNNESIYERNGKVSGNDLNRDLTPYTWYGDSSSMLVYAFNDIAEPETWWQEGTADDVYYNLRFANKPITWGTTTKMRIFTVTRRDIGARSLRTIIEKMTPLQPYDIVIINGEDAYMYVTSADLNMGLNAEPQGATTSLFNTSKNNVSEGGWIKSGAYMTRSASASQGQNNNMIYVNTLGSITTPDSSQDQPPLLDLNYAFTI